MIATMSIDRPSLAQHWVKKEALQPNIASIWHIMPRAERMIGPGGASYESPMERPRPKISIAMEGLGLFVGERVDLDA